MSVEVLWLMPNDLNRNRGKNAEGPVAMSFFFFYCEKEKNSSFCLIWISQLLPFLFVVGNFMKLRYHKLLYFIGQAGEAPGNFLSILRLYFSFN